MGSQQNAMDIFIYSFIYFTYLFSFTSLSRLFHGSYETGQSVGGAKTGEPREKTPGTPASRTWLVSHVARAEFEPTPDTAVRQRSTARPRGPPDKILPKSVRY